MVHQLEKIFRPKSIAAIGASDQERTVGNALITNLLQSNFKGKVYPVNPGHPSIAGLKSYRKVQDIPDAIDLAIIATRANLVPKIVEQCGKASVGGLLILSAGFSEAGEAGKRMYKEILRLAKVYDMRVVGPNCLGFINPSIGLNASFASGMAIPGKIAFISQSGALCTSILDWSIDQRVGFSHFVSIGSMVDVDFADLIDYFGKDPRTTSILIYLEGLKDARRFMSAARAFARNKPIILLKSGKSAAGAIASLSHTGALAGNDAAYQAGFQRAGILQVDTIQQLFNMAQALAMQPLPRGNRLAIVSNAGGPGVLATDFLIGNEGILAPLSPETMERLNQVLPGHWSHNNPIDVLGDADPRRYQEAIQACLDDDNVDAILVILTPQDVTDPVDVAKVFIAGEKDKPVFACWMGEQEVQEGREILEEGNIPNYRYPESAVDVFLRMYQYTRNLKLLYETPPDVPESMHFEKVLARDLLRNIINSRRFQLTEQEAKLLLNYYDIPTPSGKVVQSADEAASYASEVGFPVVMKIASQDIGHKTDVGGVALDIGSEIASKEAFRTIISNGRTHCPGAHIEGVRVEKMIDKKYELLVGTKKDSTFGPVIVFGSGGVLVELYKDTNMGLPPLNMALAKRIIEDTKVYELLQGYRGMPPVDIKAVQFLLVKFAYLLMDLPEIQEIDINPYVIDEKGGLALDAHVVLDENFVYDSMPPHGHLVISPYPTQYQREFEMRNGQVAILRPIRPEDEPLERAMFDSVSKQSLYYRFFSYSFDPSHDALTRFTQIDYDREMAIVAEVEENGIKKMAGVVRAINDAWQNSAEYAILVADPWQNQGLGSVLTDFILEISRERGIHKITAEVLNNNSHMSHILGKRGFSVIEQYGDEAVLELDLKNEAELAF
ncbi:MAG: bifunctional acetate--CoA ligase family protein/GNAT family N-acetyltransferase [Saprospiraceae bacterium]|nr:bifunctional acetate--CoA ligase family protein/GNAT family N-acetyltransferase [Saprospiraceae bacterium]